MPEEFKDAITEGDVELILFLINAGQNINKPFVDGMPPLNYAISIHQEEIAHILLQKGAMVHQSDSFRLDECRRCPIHYAAACNLLDMVKLLISFRAGIDELDYGHSNPFHHAAFNGNIGKPRFNNRGVTCQLCQRFFG